MHTITFCSFKGGTAKTSTALNLGTCLAKIHNKRVLLLDFDSQANLSIGLGIGPDSLDTMCPVLNRKKDIKDVIQETSTEGLYIIPANAYLDGIEKTLPLASDANAHLRLRKYLESLEGEYDYCFIDTPPSLGWLTQSAFFASHNSIICAIPEAYSIIALRRLKVFHDQIQEDWDVQALGVVLSFWDERGAINQDLLEEINNNFPNKIFTSKIRRDVAVSRAVLQGKSVVESDPTSRASQDYRDLAKEFLSKVQSPVLQSSGATR